MSVFLVTSGFAQHGTTLEPSHEFCAASLPSMPNAWRELNPDDVKRYWVSRIPAVNPPARSSSGYAYEMPIYRERLNARNALVEMIRDGSLDERAACEALRHNIRFYRNRGDQEKVETLELELLRREAVSRGDLGAVVKLQELRRKDESDLEEVVRQQSQVIEGLKRELEALRKETKRQR